MSKASLRPNREEIKAQRSKKKQQEKQLRAAQRAQGLDPQSHASHSNATSTYDSVEEEKAGRLKAVTEQIRIIKAQLPLLLKSLSKIPDPRNPKKIKHKFTLLMVYGILMFVFQQSSRRQANAQMTRPQFEANLRLLFPDLNELPHSDTLFRLLSKIDAEQLQDALIELIKRLISHKKFKRYLINNCYPVAIDGTQKMPFKGLWCEELLQRKIGKTKNKDPNENQDEHQPQSGIDAKTETEVQDCYQYYVYVLEANLAFHNGMVIPLLTEFLEFEQGDMENNKQDCEQRAFERLTKHLKKYFPSLPIILLLDGLYANGPIMKQCQKLNWQFMIVLKEKSLPTVWQEFYSLLTLSPNNNAKQAWKVRRQTFNWVNDIEYDYDSNKHIKIHVVTCDEEWEEVDENGKRITRQSHHAWISSRPLNRNNLHERCNLGARHRWGIEACFLVEKRQGYQYEHCFALDWQAMKGYHYLMRLAHALNTLARFSTALAQFFRALGVRGFFSFIYNTLTGPWLDEPEAVKAQLSRPFQLRLQ